MAIRPQPVRDREAPFDVSELFFSTTDKKGVITSCNEVFLRVAGYASDELLGAPHNVIRHPHMPRSVFFLLWERLLAGRAVGAYVKNRAKDGAHYWVFAVVTPHDGGFLSVRLKPTSPRFHAVVSLYRDLLEQEQSYGDDWRAGMRASYERLHAAVASLGFDSYDAFADRALRDELAARDAALASAAADGDGPPRRRAAAAATAGLERLDELIAQLDAREELLRSLGASVSHMASNAAVAAARLGADPEARALATISHEVSRVATHISAESRRVGQESGRLRAAATQATVNMARARLYDAQIAAFAAGRRGHDLDRDEQIARYGGTLDDLSRVLGAASGHARHESAVSLAQLRASLDVFRGVLDALGRILLTIQLSHVTGKALAAQLPHGAQFARLLTELSELAEDARERLGSLDVTVDDVQRGAARWARAMEGGDRRRQAA
ncbi:MAG: PAS domain-containing protein [Deltaproteobacteria bacterium]|nr:PAS domain-containing protein [Deltaproteobacteria bacterium]